MFFFSLLFLWYFITKYDSHRQMAQAVKDWVSEMSTTPFVEVLRGFSSVREFPSLLTLLPWGEGSAVCVSTSEHDAHAL